MPAGSFTAPDSKSYANLPAFCRVTADGLARPRFGDPHSKCGCRRTDGRASSKGTGNGGYSGGFNYPVLAAGLRRGYAVINTDQGTAPATALNGDADRRPPREMARLGFSLDPSDDGRRQSRSRQPSTARTPAHAYFSGCSTGGQQALSEAQLYPADYDGIAAGAPVVNRTHLHAAFVWSRQAAERSPGSVLGHDKLMLLKKAVVAACGPGAGGVASDTFVADPLHCAFDPASLVCKAGDAPDCLTPEQVETVKRFYAGPTNPRTGEQIYPGWARGSEGPAFGWALEEGDRAALAQGAGLRQPLQMGVRPDLGLAQFQLRPRHGGGRRGARARCERRRRSPTSTRSRRMAANCSSTTDGRIRSSIRWTRSPSTTRSPRLREDRSQLQSSARLFLLPGVEHCGSGGGEGPDAVGSEHGLPAPAGRRGA